MLKLIDKVAIVTGGASGIGAECARVLSENGATVVLADLDIDRGSSIARELPGEASCFVMDVISEQDWQQLIDYVLDKFGKLNLLAHCAGISLPGDIESTDFSLWRKILSVNLDGAYLANHYCVKAMKQNDESNAIVNISSAMSLKPHSFTSAYCASKAGVDALTKCVALHCGEQGLNIRCNSVHPGAIHTPMLERYLEMMKGDGTLEQAQQMFDSSHPVGHCGSAGDIAQGVLYLLSNDSSFVTGAQLSIDGGQSIA
ncbi:SDR family oxidoreductase [Shewanella corallii]|uniref:SDR family oxidoreductase n=1 Tax=Shewanella corallii TaxID=560080 RepID=A0ABT0NCH8_9GAMM|nr:SDR family oxidoreductase [Shewanella corallii]MCL2915487.1 SDR family oxidoreductase [Shewanella corallii]